MSRGQVWSADFTLSLVIFAAATVIAFTIILNTLDDREYEAVRQQAVNAAALLAGEGYPRHWESAGVLRAGLISDDRLSMRKANDMPGVVGTRLRQSLRITDSFYIHFTNSSGDTVPVFGQCGIGDLTVPVIARNMTLPAAGISSGAHPLLEAVNITPSPADTALGNLSAQDVIIIEGPISSTLSESRIRSLLDEAAERGITFIVAGDPGVEMLGIDVNATPALQLEVQGTSGAQLLLADSETIDLQGPVTIPTIETPAGVTGFRAVAITDQGKTAYATWIYGDARVWYIATQYGVHSDGRNLTLTLANATQRMVTVQWPECGEVQAPDADQVAVQRRTIVHHDDLLQLNVMIWRAG